MQVIDGRASTTQLVTGIAVPLGESCDLAADAQFGQLVGTGVTAPKDGDDEHLSDDYDNAALQELQVLRSSPEKPVQVLVQACARVTVLTAQVIRLLRLETEVELDKPLTAYGLDDLSAVELRGWLRARLGAGLSALDVTNAPSLVSL
ncbi:hypothetical protein SLS62_001112 [Diatrype stigma]|uniref:Carrier domain-containing protein n=1 Tax=Diatrype stigma TaxID=117547 RepID=A0AAN9UZB4_9PEZI